MVVREMYILFSTPVYLMTLAKHIQYNFTPFIRSQLIFGQCGTRGLLETYSVGEGVGIGFMMMFVCPNDFPSDVEATTYDDLGMLSYASL